MEQHIKAARIHRALAWFCVVVAMAMAFSEARRDLDDFGTIEWARIIELLVFFLAFAVLHFATARGARTRQTWARKTSKACGALLLIGFPIGSLPGIYLLKNNDWDLPRKRSSRLAEAWPAPAMPQAVAEASKGNVP